ncbi:MAG: MFS transporter [Dehalococcoidia bacterium]
MSSPLKAMLPKPPEINEHTIMHYAWVIVAVGAVAQMVGSAIRMSFGVLITPLEETFGWSPGAIGLAYAWMSIVTALFSPIAGSMGTRFGARRTMSVGVALFFIGMMWTSQTGSLWELYISYGLVFGIAQALFLVPVIPAVANWFRRHLGLGTGIMMVSWSLGPAIAVQVMALLFESVGWQETFIIAGVVGTVVLGGLMLLFKDTPEQAGKKPYGWKSGDKPLVTKGEVYNKQSRQFQGFIYRTNAFWNLINIHFLGCAGHAIILVGIIPLATHRGLSLLEASSILALISAVSVSTRFLAPVLSDKIGSKGVMFFCFFGQGAGVLMLLWANTPLEFYLFAILWAVPYGGEGTAFPVINRQYYGHSPMGPTYGWQLLGAGLGMALGGALPGMVFDITGAYTWAIILSAAFSLAGAAAILALEPTRDPLIPDWADIEAESEPVARPAGATGHAAAGD